MLHHQFPLALVVTIAMAAEWTAFAADTPTFPSVPPPSPNLPSSSSVTFPAVPPPSPVIRLAVAVFPEVPPPSPYLAPSPTTSGSTAAVAGPAVTPADVRAQRAEESKAKKEKQAAREREAKAQRDLAAAKKSGKAPASAYAAPTVADVPRAFAGKEAELQELLARYKSGEITPEEYHGKRAQIIARP